MASTSEKRLLLTGMAYSIKAAFHEINSFH